MYRQELPINFEQQEKLINRDKDIEQQAIIKESLFNKRVNKEPIEPISENIHNGKVSFYKNKKMGRGVWEDEYKRNVFTKLTRRRMQKKIFF